MKDASPLERKLAAVLYADVAGYSRLTGEDEEGTHRALRDCLDAMASHIESAGGRVVHYAGDAVLADFPTVLDAVTCAIDVQRALAARNAGLPLERQVQFRIGVNLGDIIVDRDDIYGDGVNIAARLESLAPPGGICVSGTVYEALGNRAPVPLQYMGEQQVKNIATPVRTYRVVMDGSQPAAESDEGATPRGATRRPRALAILIVAVALAVALGIALDFGPLTRREARQQPATAQPGPDASVADSAEQSSAAAQEAPSIAVLPFVNLSNDPQQEYFSDGLTEDLITDLSKISGLLVIARNSTFAYKGQSVNIQRIGSELGARYVLEGSVRRAATRVRINAQLIDASNGTHLWAERYDRDLTDVFALQDEVTRTIVEALAVNLTLTEQASLASAPRVNPDAYDALLRGNERLNHYTPESLLEARAYYRQAIALDPGYARAHANLAYTYAIYLLFGWDTDEEEAAREGIAAAEAALALDDRIPQIHFTLGNLYIGQHRPEAAVASARRSIELDPNYADGYGMLAVALTFAGNHAEALSAIDRGIRLNPRHSYMYLWVKGRILFHLERFEQAVTLLEEAVSRNPSFDQGRLVLAATYAQMGRLEDASWQAEEALALRPDFTIAQEMRRYRLYKRAQDEARYIEGLRKAGLPQ